MNINTNTTLTGLNNLSKISYNQEKSIEKLSSGLRITRASDDAAGLAISKSFACQASSLDVNRRNIMDGISLIQTADGALEEISSMLNRAFQLSVQSSNSTYSKSDSELILKEVEEIKEAIESIVQKTNFNGINLFEGNSIEIRTGINVDDVIELQTDNLNHLVRHLTVKGANGEKTVATVDKINSMLNRVSSARASLGATISC